jgi:hypothetical protein
MFWTGVDLKTKTFLQVGDCQSNVNKRQRMPNHRYDDGKMRSALGSCTCADIQTYDGLAQVDHDPV